MSRIKLRVYVTGGSLNSDRAIQNLRTYCEADPEQEYEMEVYDVLERPDLAEQDRIVATPTLIRLKPLPEKRIVGDLSARELVCNILGIDTEKLKRSTDESHTYSGDRE